MAGWLLRPQLKRYGYLLSVLLCVGAASATEYHGRVLIGGVPIPGATVTVTQGTKHLSTTTDSQGLYEFPDLADGAWKIEIEMRGFAKLDGDVTIAANAAQGDWDLKLLSLDQMLAETKVVQPEAKPLQPREVLPAATTGPVKADARADAKKGKDEGPVAAPAVEEAERPSDGLLINGSESNASTSPFSLSPAFGNRRPGVKGLYNGGIGVIADNSVFDAKPYSLSGLQIPKDAYSRVTMLLTLGGPIRIPPLFYHGPNFFLAYQWTRNKDASTAQGLVPDVAYHQTPFDCVANNSCAQGATPAAVTVPGPQIYVPSTLATNALPAICGTPGSPFVGNVIPAACLSSAAQQLLSLYPAPNVTGSSIYNYERGIVTNSHDDALQSRLNKSIGRRDQLYGGFGFQSIRSDSVNLFNFHDTTNTLGIDTNANWSHRYAHQIFVLLGYHLTRQRTETRPQFSHSADISGNAGITGNDTDPTNWGPPTLSFSSGYAGLTDGISAFNRNRTDATSAKADTTRGRHTITVGGDFRRQEFNQFAQQNPRGNFTFTGAATSATGATSTTSGSDLADFLVGVPDTSALAYGNPDKYFRQSVYDLYVNDDWRVRPELTIKVGMRWEYGAPPTELKGRLVNLDVASGFSAVTPVLGSSPKGALTGMSYPTSLVNPDKRGFEPRIGVSWRPIPASTLVVRAGYGIYDDTSGYLTSAESMSQQAPLSTSVSVSNSATCSLTLVVGFRNCAGTTPDTFAIDPNWRVGYAQAWQLSAQRDLPQALVMTVTYSGIKGTRGMQEFLPNTYPIGATNPCPRCPVGFIYRTSNGNSTREAGEVQLRRRLRAGFTASVDYTFSKSLDDDSQVGSQGHVVGTAVSSASSSSEGATTASPVVAQNWLNLRAERERSTFDQRHLVNGQIQYTTGMGMGGGTLLTGWRGRAFKEWTVLAQFSAGSGLPETPIYLAAVPGTGVTGTIRPNLTGAPIHVLSDGRFLNAAAYTAPAAGQWGNASRDSITGPGTFSLNGSLARTFRLKAPFNLDVKLDAQNLLNHAVYTGYNTTINSTGTNTTFGLPTAVNGMRTVQITGRLRF